MGGVSVDGGGRGGGRKSVDVEISMVPMIDLLLCCIMFLLVTAVWSQLASMAVRQDVVGMGGDPVESAPAISLILSVRESGLVLGDTAGARREIPNRGGAHDLSALRAELGARRSMEPNRRELVVAPEDGVDYADVMAAMDVSAGQGFSELSLSAGAAP